MVEVVACELQRNYILWQVEHLDIVGLSWHKATLLGTKTAYLNQTWIVDDIMKWNTKRKNGEGRMPLLLVAEWGVYPVRNK